MGKDLETILAGFVAETESAAGPSLRAIVLYGSASCDDYLPGRSDINLLLVVDQVDLGLLDGLQKRTGAWSKKRITTPLVVDRGFLPSSIDSYPLEILGMLAGYRILSGVDPFEGLMPEKEHVRLQTEREIKAKALFLQSGYMESCGKQQRLLGYLIGALPAMDAILRGALFLQDSDWKRSGKSLHAACAATLGIDGAVLDAIWEARAGRKRPDRTATISFYEAMLATLRALAGLVERPGASA